MADSKLTALSELSVPAFEDLTYAVDDPSGTPVSNKLTLARVMGMGGFLPGGRLTLTTGTPVTTSDVTSAGTLYYTPYLHNRIRVWDGTRWLYKSFSEISLSLTLTSGKNYDVFVDDDAATLVLSAAWTNDTTRADALGTQDSVTVLNSDKTKLWLGTIRASGSNVTEDSGGGTSSQVGGKRFVWNAYNQVPRFMAVKDTTDSWTYNTNTWRQANAASGNKVEYVSGVAGTLVEAFLSQGLKVQSGGYGIAGIGVDSTTGTSAYGSAAYIQTDNHDMNLAYFYSGYPGLGYHYISWNENGSSATCTRFGDNGGGIGDQSGLRASIMG